MKMLKIIYASFVVFAIVFAGAVANAENKEGNGTIYEQHVGIFAPKARSISNEPLLGTGNSIKKVTKPIFNVLGSADHFLGKALHSKTYAEDDNDSFVTLEREGAKLGYDF